MGILASLLIIGCVHFVSYYDSVSYKNLTDLKGGMKVFFEACQNNIAKGEKALGTLDSFVITSAKAYEYERGKQLNDDTVQQWEIIEKTVSEVRSRYEKNKISAKGCTARNTGTEASTGCLTIGYCKGKWMALESAFDIAISTEQLKLKESE